MIEFMGSHFEQTAHIPDHLVPHRRTESHSNGVTIPREGDYPEQSTAAAGSKKAGDKPASMQFGR